MSVNDLETIASRLRDIVTYAVEFGQSRWTVLDVIEALANDLEDEATRLAITMAKELNGV